MRNRILCLFLIILCLRDSDSAEDNGTTYNTYTISSVRYSRMLVKPYDAQFIRVDLPLWFSSVSLLVESDVKLDVNNVNKSLASTFQIICFREGSRPAPDTLDASDVSSGSISSIPFEEIQDYRNVKCYRMQNNFTLRLTNEEISPGVWYVALLNGFGLTNSQSKMIIRRPAYTFSANMTIEGCANQMALGQFCNTTVHQFSCGRPDDNQTHTGFKLQAADGNVLSCAGDKTCQAVNEQKVYSFDILVVVEELIISANNISGSNQARLTARARYGGIPTSTNFDYLHDINISPLIIHFPKVGRWFILAVPVEVNGNSNSQLCYSMESHLLGCPTGNGGENCTHKKTELQSLILKESFYESFFLPANQEPLPDPTSFPLEALSNNATWSYFLLRIPFGAAGGNLHVQLSSAAKIKCEVYVRFGALPSVEHWDYYYANNSSRNNSMFFASYSKSDRKVDFYILYAREGTWSIGLRYLKEAARASHVPTTMTVSLERCPKQCSSHGRCVAALDVDGLTTYSYCTCDRTHGGFDCGVEVVSHQGHVWQSVALISSNVAAALPAFWALRKKEYAEWVLFTSSGVSSGLYHACDVGTWCALSFGVLQFMDFWLSFMAVVSTFAWMSTIDESSRRTIHTVVAILTALMAITKATRSSNIALVVSIGAAGLLVGWMLEYSTKRRPHSRRWSLDITTRWQMAKAWLHDTMKNFISRFRWRFVAGGLTALAMAAASWTLESSETYWVWHSLWHLSIYTCSFLFLCSKADSGDRTNGSGGAGGGVSYALTRQVSSRTFS